MKRFIITFAILQGVFSFAQSYSVKYAVSQLEKKYKIKTNVKSYLRGSAVASAYIIDFTNSFAETKEENTVINLGGNALYFKDFTNKTVTYIDAIKMNSFVINDTLANVQWKLLPDQKTILGYNCQKATCEYRGRPFSVYFSSELPFSDGPYKFTGLPGLILELSSDDGIANFEILAEEVKVTPNQIEIDNPLAKEKAIPYAKFKSIYQEKYEEFLHKIVTANGETRPIGKGFLEYFVE
jgi:GLPGLI family protein